MTQGLWYFCGISTADETFDIAYSRLPSENKRRIKKKRRKKKCGEREKWKRNMYVRIRKTRRERNDRQKWLADKENESETNKIDRTRRESRARCRGTLVVFASMGKGQQIHWPRETPVSTEVSPRSPPSSPRTASAIVSLRPSQGPTHARARGPYVHCLWRVAFPPTRLRVTVELKRITLFASQLLVRNSTDRQVTSDKKYHDFQWIIQYFLSDYLLIYIYIIFVYFITFNR